MSESRRGDFYLIFLGLLIGFAVSSFVAPRTISWYSNPPFAMGVNCTPGIDWGMSNLIKWQVASMALFSLGLWLISALIRRRREV